MLSVRHNTFRFYATQLDFDEAATHCNAEYNATLWSIESIEEQNWVLDNIVPVSQKTQDARIWIGLEDRQIEGRSH